MTRGIDPRSDAGGLEQAALELMEEALDAPERARLERLAAVAANGEAILSRLPQRRTLSPGYYQWIAYVQSEIVEPMEMGVTFTDGNLRSEEMIALVALRRARGEFRRLHPPCRGCGTPLENAGLKRCGDCEMAAARGAR